MPAGFTAKSARTMVEGLGTVEFRCHNCGYGISLTGELPRCPMCRRRSWQRLPRRRALTLKPRP